MEYKTITGRRPDLEKIEVNAPIGYIGSRIYPVLTVAEKAGTIYYAGYVADSAAQTGRSAGAAPTRTLLASSSTTYSVAEAIKRYGITRDEVKQYGGIEKADEVGAMAAKRSVQRAIENAQAAKLFSTARYSAASDISDSVFAGLQAAAKSVKRYEGDLALVLSEDLYLTLIQKAEIKEILGRFVPGGITADQLYSVQPTAFKSMLQGLYGFREVLIGDSNHWTISGKENAAAVVKLPSAETQSHKMAPVLGKNVLYLPDGTQEYEIESYYDENDKTNNYDASTFYNLVEFNADAAVLVKIDADEVAST